MDAHFRTEQLKRHATVLRDLSRRGHWHLGDRAQAFREICEVASRTLGSERTSIWLYDESRSRIVCANLFEDSLDKHSSGQELARANYPSYFAALEEERTIAADDAATNRMTREFADSYLAPLGISSMLDAPIMTGGRCVGVICHEHVGPKRIWTPEEESFAGSLGDFAALTLEAEQRRDVEERLREREQELRRALQAASMGTWTWCLSDDSIQWSDEVGPLFGRPPGWSPASYEGYLELVYPQDRELVSDSCQRTIDRPTLPHYLQHRIVHSDGSVRWIEARGQIDPQSSEEPVLLHGTVSDCTERRELEIQLIQAQKMQSIGQLAGGIAHDFNNLLTAVSGFSEILLSDQTLSDDQRSSVGFIADASERAAALTRQLLTFARRQPLQTTVVDVAALIEGVSNLLQRMIGEHVTLETRLGASAMARVDAGQIEQVLINLSLNARDAMPDGGDLIISAESIEIDDVDDVDREGSLAAGRYVCIDVVDTGSGIPSEILPRIFEPFYTTKPAGQGTGLGLSTCYGIVRQSGGEIRVETAIGEGTTFRVMLPEAVGAMADEGTRPDPAKGPGGGETLLVVEDEELVRRITVSVLRRAGYQVLIAHNADEAVEIARAADRPIDLVVANAVLPNRTGDHVIEVVRRIHPGVGALVVSGDLPEVSGAKDVPKGNFLRKPFRPIDLTNLVREILDRGAR